MPTVPPTQAGVKIVFQTPYRSGTKEWSQLWHFTGGSWQDSAHFVALYNALKAQLQGLLPSRTTFVEAVGYNPGSFVPVFTHTDGANGSSSVAGVPFAPLEAAMLARFSTTQRSTKNHPIYLYKWFHGIWTAGTTTPDQPPAGAISNMNSNLTTILAGLSDGTLTRDYCGPRGAVAQSRLVLPDLHMREFPT